MGDLVRNRLVFTINGSKLVNTDSFRVNFLGFDTQTNNTDSFPKLECPNTGAPLEVDPRKGAR